MSTFKNAPRPPRCGLPETTESRHGLPQGRPRDERHPFPVSRTRGLLVLV
jgi:hypothetical protein